MNKQKKPKRVVLGEGIVHGDGTRGTVMVGNKYLTTDWAFNKKILNKKIRLIAEVIDE